MKHISNFENFLNEGKEWWEFDEDKIIKAFLRDYKNPQRKADSDALHNWLNDFAWNKRIESETPASLVKYMEQELQKKGYKNIKAAEVINFAPYQYKMDIDIDGVE
jgi:hypothetical protein